MMFTFVNYTIITCYVACVRHHEPRLCLLVRNKGPWSPSRQQQHKPWEGQKKHAVVICQARSHHFPSLEAAKNCWQCTCMEMVVLLANSGVCIRVACPRRTKVEGDFAGHGSRIWFDLLLDLEKLCCLFLITLLVKPKHRRSFFPSVLCMWTPVFSWTLVKTSEPRYFFILLPL